MGIDKIRPRTKSSQRKQIQKAIEKNKKGGDFTPVLSKILQMKNSIVDVSHYTINEERAKSLGKTLHQLHYIEKLELKSC